MKYDEFKDLIKTKEIIAFKKDQENGNIRKDITIQERFSPTNTLGAISEKAYERINKLNPSLLLQEVFALKYKRGMVEPGEAVGCTAAQSIG